MSIQQHKAAAPPAATAPASRAAVPATAVPASIAAHSDSLPMVFSFCLRRHRCPIQSECRDNYPVNGRTFSSMDNRRTANDPLGRRAAPAAPPDMRVGSPFQRDRTMTEDTPRAPSPIDTDAMLANPSAYFNQPQD